MAITFFIGNGFDLGLGLKTSYKDFYKYFKENIYDLNSTNQLFKMIKNDEINDYENWSDLELSLGRYSSVYNNEVDLFKRDFLELQHVLFDYLKAEEDKCSNFSEEMQKEFINGINLIENDFTEEDKREFIQYKNRNGAIRYDFIEFNYTSCFDRITSAIKKENFVAHTHNGLEYKDYIGSKIHLHGTLEETPILGVNNEEQIENELLKKNDRIKKIFIKPIENDSLKNGNHKKVQSIINDSQYVFVYGMSIGNTDNCWWEYLGKWLLNNKEHRLVVSDFRDYKPIIASERVDYQEDLIDKFLSHTKLNNAEKTEVRGRVVPMINPEYFKGIKFNG